MKLDNFWATGMQSLVHLVYPPRCLSCGGLVESDFGLCTGCWKDTPFVAGLGCEICDRPLPGQSDRAETCDDCLRYPRSWTKGRTAMIYRGTGRNLVLGLKHGGRQDIAKPAAGWMARRTREIVQDGMIAVPVPLHLHRLLRRRYNQSALLAEHLAAELGIDWCADALRRVEATPPMGSMGPQARLASLQDKIRIAEWRTRLIEGRPVLLVDDVMTTGATLSACANACLAAGASEVRVSILARTDKDA